MSNKPFSDDYLEVLSIVKIYEFCQKNNIRFFKPEDIKINEQFRTKEMLNRIFRNGFLARLSTNNGFYYAFTKEGKHNAKILYDRVNGNDIKE